jgi:hypothetical protein
MYDIGPSEDKNACNLECPERVKVLYVKCEGELGCLVQAVTFAFNAFVHLKIFKHLRHSTSSTLYVIYLVKFQISYLKYSCEFCLLCSCD